MADQSSMRFLPGLRLGGLGRDTLLTTSGLVVRAVLQAAYLIVLSRWLGAQGYGLFSGSVAAAILLAPLSGWGMGYVFTEQLAQGGAVRRRALWRAVASQAAISGLLLALIVAVVATTAMDVRVSAMDMLLLALGELVALPLAQVSSVALLAMNRSGMAAVMVCLVPALRLLGVGILIASGAAASAHHVVLAHSVSALAAIPMLLIIIRGVLLQGSPGVDEPPRWPTLVRAGAPYAVSALAGNAYFEIDKVLILQVAGAEAAGTYTAAFRVVIVFLLPIMALQSNALPRLFAAGSSEPGERLLKKVAAVSIAYGLCGALMALVVSPFLPLLFGVEYEESKNYLVMLAAWVPLFALHQSAATALVAFGGKNKRLAVEAAGLVLVVVLNLILLPRMGASGAALALLVTECFMALACWTLLGRQRNQH